MEREQFLSTLAGLISDEFAETGSDTLLVSRIGATARRAFGGAIWQSLQFPSFRSVLEELESQGKLKCDTDHKDAFIVRRNDQSLNCDVTSYSPTSKCTKISPFIKLRPPVWDAFVRVYPAYGLRYIHSSTGAIVVGTKEAPAPAENWKVLSPILEETQKSWALEFVREHCPDLESKINVLFNDPAWYIELAKMLRDVGNNLIADWNRHRTSNVVAVVRDWCESNNVSFNLMATSNSIDEQRTGNRSGVVDSVTCEGGQLESTDLRRKMLEILARVPTDELMNLKVSLKYLIDEESKFNVSDCS